MFVRIDAGRHAIAPHRAFEAIPRGDRAFIGVEPGKDLTARIVDLGHEHTLGATSLEPVMIRAVQLYQLAPVRFPGSPRPMGPRSSLEVRHPCGPQPAAYGFGAEDDAVPLGQLLRREGGSNIAIMLHIQPEYPDLQCGPVLSVRRRASEPRHEARGPLRSDPLDQSPYLTRRQPHDLASLPWPQRLVHHLPDLQGPASTLSRSSAPCPLQPYCPPSEGRQSTQEDISTLVKADILLLGLHPPIVDSMVPVREETFGVRRNYSNGRTGETLCDRNRLRERAIENHVARVERGSTVSEHGEPSPHLRHTRHLS